MSLYTRIRSLGKGEFSHSVTADQVTEGLDLSGRTVLLTGCNSGIGLETLRTLVRRGARVVAAARTVAKARAACDGLDRIHLESIVSASGVAGNASSIRTESGSGETLPIACDLSNPSSVRACVQQLEALDCSFDAIICNAGIMALPQLEQCFGIERQFFTNHIGHFMLVTALINRLTEAGRVVIVSSAAHNAAPRGGIEFDNLSGEKNYRPWAAYGQSKLANLLFARGLAHRLRTSGGRTANALHPGVIKTNLARHMPWPARVALTMAGPFALKSMAQGAATQCYLAVHPRVEGVSGEYFADCQLAVSSPDGQNMELAERLWRISEQIVESL